jgi:type IV secretory pathway VirB4 component
MRSLSQTNGQQDWQISTTFKAFFIDKAWVFLKNPSIQGYVVEAPKTGGKQNAAMMLPTQSLDELRRSDVLDVIIERGRPSRSRWDVR